MLSGEYRLRIFRNTVPQKIFAHEKEDVTGNWRKLLTEGGFTHVIYAPN
jgi:hypothetical protein